jgi:D-threo-aldose 1-dehydrogenase
VLRRVGEIAEVCDRHDVPLPAAAVQFSMRDERISSTVVGMSTPERVAETIRLASWPIPTELWEEI